MKCVMIHPFLELHFADTFPYAYFWDALKWAKLVTELSSDASVHNPFGRSTPSGGGALLDRSRHRFLVRIGRIIAAFCIPSELVQFAQKYSEFMSHHNPILLVTVHFLYHSLSFLQATLFLCSPRFAGVMGLEVWAQGEKAALGLFNYVGNMLHILFYIYPWNLRLPFNSQVSRHYQTHFLLHIPI